MHLEPSPKRTYVSYGIIRRHANLLLIIPCSLSTYPYSVGRAVKSNIAMNFCTTLRCTCQTARSFAAKEVLGICQRSETADSTPLWTVEAEE